ncbi:MAG: hypothetical protein JWN90_569 [Parcubacteria group bacterium]|nr:hypothetical protein [Parcubacteria group bacterium]
MRIPLGLFVAVFVAFPAQAQQTVSAVHLDPRTIIGSQPVLYVPTTPGWNVRIRPWVEHSTFLDHEIIRIGSEWNSQVLDRLWFVTNTSRIPRIASIRSTRRLNLGFALNVGSEWRLKGFAQSDTAVRHTRFFGGIGLRF